VNRFVRSFLIALLLLPGNILLAEQTGKRKMDWFGDFRLRLEQDWDSLAGDGSKRDDRLRMRIRLRGGFSYGFTDKWSATVAARTGQHASQQSPHITIYDFDDGPEGPYQLDFDHWYLKYTNGGFESWVGRNELSFWHQDDTFIFDNVTYPGMGVSYQQDLQAGALTWNANLVALPVGMRNVAGAGFMGEVVYDRDFEKSSIVVAGGYYGTWADPDDADGDALLTENGKRDYRVLDLEFLYRSHLFGKSYQLGFNYSYNIKNYHSEPPGSFSRFHENDVNAFVLHLEWGDRGERGDWLFAYYYAYIEALGRHSSYIQDDWVRWGNASQVRATNMKGSEFRVVYTLRSNMNIFARLFLVDAIDLLEPGDTTRETGNRFRIDWNISF
jgi:hypothetical protein